MRRIRAGFDPLFTHQHRSVSKYAELRCDARPASTLLSTAQRKGNLRALALPSDTACRGPLRARQAHAEEHRFRIRHARTQAPSDGYVMTEQSERLP